MKTIRKALLATAVATALSPAAVMADTTVFGNFDIGFAVETAAEEAFVVYDSPAADNVIGIEGELELENGNAVTYQYVFNVDLDNDTGGNSAGAGNTFGANYHSYVGYKMEALEVRLGNLDLPLRLALDKADQFAGTYADQNNIIASNNNGGAGNTTAANTIMALGGNDTLAYAVSVSATSENANTKQGSTSNRYGAMADFAVSDNISVAAGIEAVANTGTSGGISANIGLTDSLELSTAINMTDVSGGNDSVEAVLGLAFGLSDMTTLKFQTAMNEVDTAGTNAQPAAYYAIGADFAMAENVTTYVLAAQGKKGGLSTVEADGAGANEDGSVLAAGIKLSF
jgi:hypothetical protein